MIALYKWTILFSFLGFGFLSTQTSFDHHESLDESIVGIWETADKHRKIQFYSLPQTNEQNQIKGKSKAETKMLYRGKVIWLSPEAIAKIKKTKGIPEDELQHDVFFLEYHPKTSKWKGKILVGKKPKKAYPCSVYLSTKHISPKVLWVSIFGFRQKMFWVSRKF